MTSILGAEAFLSKGHYLDLSKEAEVSKPTILKDGKEVVASYEQDDTYFGVESLTGTTLITKERHLLSLVIE